MANYGIPMNIMNPSLYGGGNYPGWQFGGYGQMGYYPGGMYPHYPHGHWHHHGHHHHGHHHHHNPYPGWQYGQGMAGWSMGQGTQSGYAPGMWTQMGQGREDFLTEEQPFDPVFQADPYYSI